MPESASRPSVGAARHEPGGVRPLDEDAIPGLVPDHVHALLERLWSSGHAAYVVGGSLRDALLSGTPSDWDITTDARPSRIQSLFPGSHSENRYGTVLVPTDADDVIEIPWTVEPLQPILSVVPTQLLAYYIALRRGADIDQPRNLAKSVTVE